MTVHFEQMATVVGDDALLNSPVLARRLSERGFALDRDFGMRRFSRGFGNMNFLVVLNGTHAVLRRPPPGPVPAGANDMAREYLILSRLRDAFPLVPRPLHFCDDPAVMGVPFFLMEYVPGLVIGGDMPAEVVAAWRGQVPVGVQIADNLIRVLSRLHAVSPSAVGLDTLGRPERFAERALAGWRSRAVAAWDGHLPSPVKQLLDWLEPRVPTTDEHALIHNDFKLDNVILDEETLDPKAVIDWDMGTRGHPLYDLAVVLSYWTERGDPCVMHELRQMPTAGDGFPTREAAAARYAALSGRKMDDFLFFRVLASLRLAVVFQQLFRRSSSVQSDARFSTFDSLAAGLASFGVEISRERFF